MPPNEAVAASPEISDDLRADVPADSVCSGYRLVAVANAASRSDTLSRTARSCTRRPAVDMVVHTRLDRCTPVTSLASRTVSGCLGEQLVACLIVIGGEERLEV